MCIVLGIGNRELSKIDEVFDLGSVCFSWREFINKCDKFIGIYL